MQCWVSPRDFLSSSQCLLSSQNDQFHCHETLGISYENILNSSEGNHTHYLNISSIVTRLVGIEVEHASDVIIKYEDLNMIKQLEEGMTGLIWLGSWKVQSIGCRTHSYP